MFYYNDSKDPQLEVSIVENFTQEDVERLLFFINALLIKSQLQVIFKIHPSRKNEFLTFLNNDICTPTYQFHIN